MVERRIEAPKMAWTLALLLPPLLFVGLHARSLDYDFVWTDQAEIEKGLLIRPPGAILGAFQEPTLRGVARLAPGSVAPYYRPLQVAAVSAIDHRFGRGPAGFRAVNLVAGAITLALFALLVGVLFRDPLLAGIASALVAVHPAGIEDHVWIAGMPSSFVALFRVLGLLTVPMALRARGAWRRGVWVALGLIALGLGLASKEDALVTPGLTLACVVSLGVLAGRAGERRDDARRRVFLSTGAAMVIAQLALCLAYLLWWRPAVLGGSFAGTPPAGGSLGVHYLTVLATWPGRLGWLLWPADSTTSDVVPLVSNVLEPLTWLGGLLAVAAPLLWLRLLSTGRPVLAFGWAWMVLGFLPASGIVPLTHLRAERYLAPAVYGLGLIVGQLLCRGVRQARGTGARWAVPVAVLGLALVLGLAQRTWARIPDWRSDLALFERDVGRDPMFREGYLVLATVLSEEGRNAEARLWLDRLVEANREFGARWSFFSEIRALELICDVNFQLARGAETLPYFGADLRPDAPGLSHRPGLYRCGARSLEQAGRVDDALEIYHALRALPGWRRHPDLMLDVARALALKGDLRVARGWLRQVPETPHNAGEIRAVEEILAELEAADAGSG